MTFNKGPDSSVLTCSHCHFEGWQRPFCLFLTKKKKKDSKTWEHITFQKLFLKPLYSHTCRQLSFVNLGSVECLVCLKCHQHLADGIEFSGWLLCFDQHWSLFFAIQYFPDLSEWLKKQADKYNQLTHLHLDIQQHLLLMSMYNY